MKGNPFSRSFPPGRKVITANVSNRSLWVVTAIHEFLQLTYTDQEDALCDLLADLMHWCDEHQFDFDNELRRARGHYEAEVNE